MGASSAAHAAVAREAACRIAANPLWDGVGLYAYMYGGCTVIGCSLPPGDPYVVQFVHHICTDYSADRGRHGVPWRQDKIKVIDLQRGAGVREFKERFRFVSPAHGDFALDGFGEGALEFIFGSDADGSVTRL